jgi:hypothetical protein
MKPVILFFTALLFAVSVFGQEAERKKPKFPFEEFTLSVNRTNVAVSGRENRFGGGAGMYHAFRIAKPLDLVLGIEYNYTSLFLESLWNSHFNYVYDVTYHIHNIPLSLSFRVNIGKNIKYFVEVGTFVGMSCIGKNGYEYVNEYDPLIGPDTPTSQTKKPVKINTTVAPSFGPSFGMGIRIPMKSIEWMVKADYRIEGFKIEGNPYEFHNQYYRLAVGIRKNTTYKR